MSLLVLAAKRPTPSLGAASAGLYESNKKSYPRLQVLSVSDLLAGRARAEYPDLAQVAHTFKKAKVDQGDATQQKLELK